MELSFWESKWQKGQIGFHLQQPHSLLQKYWSSLNLPCNATVLVPLCGKSHDMSYLSARGHYVIGVEISSIAIEQFFAEQKLNFNKTMSNGFAFYSAGNICLVQADFLQLETSDYPVHIDAVYDRAALVALPADMRMAYAKKLRQILRANTNVFIVCVEYEQGFISPPPFHVDEKDLSDLFDGWCWRTELACIPSKLKGKDIVERLYSLEVLASG